MCKQRGMGRRGWEMSHKVLAREAEGKGIKRAMGDENHTYLGGVDRWSGWPMA